MSIGTLKGFGLKEYKFVDAKEYKPLLLKSFCSNILILNLYFEKINPIFGGLKRFNLNRPIYKFGFRKGHMADSTLHE